MQEKAIPAKDWKQILETIYYDESQTTEYAADKITK